MATGVATGNSSLVMDKLKGIENYNSWKFMMKMVLIHEDLWDFVEKEPTDAEHTKKVQKALARIALSVQPAAFSHVRSAKTAHEAWTNLQKAYEDRGLCRRLALLRALFSTKLENQSMESYINRIVEISQQLSDIGSPLEDDFIAIIMLSGLTEDYDPLIMAIENSNIKLSSEVVQGKLLQENLRRDDKNESGSALAAVRKQPKCFRCKKTGHFIKDCPQKTSGWKKNTNMSNMKKVDESKALLTALSANIEADSWYIDSGATSHMCCDRSVMCDFVKSKSLEVKVANGDKLYTEGTGTVRIKLANGAIKTVSNVYYVPKLSGNLLSVSSMVKKGFKVVFSFSGCHVYDNGVEVVSATLDKGMYKLNIAETLSATPSTVTDTPQEARENLVVNAAVECGNYETETEPTPAEISEKVWHRRLGHLNRRSMKLLNQGMVSGISYNDSTFEPCVACIQGKQNRLPFPKKSYNRATEPLELVHTDLCGPMPCSSLSGSKYFLLFIDDFSRKTFVYFLKTKSEVFEKFKSFKVLVENQTGRKIKVLRSDNGGEYINSNFQMFLKDNGIRHQTTVPHSPQQNGVAERANRTIMEAARCMLQDANLAQEFWAEAVNTAVHIRNHCPTKAVMGCTPEEKWTNRKVSIKHFRIFGCVAYALNPNRKKLDSKCKSYIFVGYCDDTKGYRLIDPEFPTNCIKARNVTFLENKLLSKVSNDDSEKTVEQFSQVQNCTHDESRHVQTNLSEPPVQSESSVVNTDLSDDTILENNQRYSVITINDSESSRESSPEASDPADETYVPDSSEEDDESLSSNMVSVSYEEDTPQNVQEALGGKDAKHWKEAMTSEYESFIDNNCWTLTDRSESHKPVKCKWVFKIKRGLNGELLKYRARLVAKGCTQKYGIDYEETFSPVVRYSTIRTLLALAAEYNMEIEHLDVKTAFLNGDLTETVFMEQPEGFQIKGQEHKVYKLNKAIYGLKQASKAWYEKIDHVLCNKLNFVRSSSEPCVYIKSNNNSIIIIALYVDDIILFSTCNLQEKLSIKQKLMKEFQITDLGPAQQILGMKLCKDNDKITLDQSSYIQRVLQKYKMEDCKPSPTPMESGLKLPRGHQKDDNLDYRGLVGCLMYIAVCSRPDIAHAVSYLSQFNESFSEIHWKAAKRVLRYLKGTINNCLVFQKGGLDVTAYADADWANDDGDRRSYTGYVFTIGKSIVSWESRKQKTVALSSTEAEYISLTEACKEGLFIRKFLKDIIKESIVITIHNDNQSALKLCKNSLYHSRTKHIDVRHHFIRKYVSDKIVILKYLCTNDMLADILTKPLCKIKHNLFVNRLLLVK